MDINEFLLVSDVSERKKSDDINLISKSRTNSLANVFHDPIYEDSDDDYEDNEIESPPPLKKAEKFSQAMKSIMEESKHKKEAISHRKNRNRKLFATMQQEPS